MKKFLSLILVLAMVLSLAACGKKAEAAEPVDTTPVVEEPVQEEEPVVEEEEAVSWAYINPLTGEATEEDISANRPIAVMLNNIKQSLPQSGNSMADVLYEVPEEGGITRIMGLYQDMTNVGTLGTIRSTRPYYVRLAVGNDSILIHAGGSGAAYSLIQDYMTKYGMVDLDFLSKGTRCANIFYRDQNRLASGYSSEHTLFTNSDSIQNYLAEHAEEIRQVHKEDYVYPHTFVEDATPVNGMDALSITASFSGYKSTAFDYSEEEGVYYIREIYPTVPLDTAYIDQANGNKQVSVENVIIIQTIIEELNDAKHHVAVDIVGGGSGYFACNGKMQKITWKKEKAKLPYHFYDEDGNELSLGIGKSFVCILDGSRNITVDGTVMEKPDYANGSTDLSATTEALDDDEAE